MKVLGIDPGLDTGWCVVDGQRIVSCGLGETWPSSKFDLAVIERPHVYRPGKNKKQVDPNDLITLAIQVGEYKRQVSLSGTPVKLVEPGTWKGQVPKEIHHARIIADLSPEDAATVVQGLARVAESKAHNVLDGVALALWASKRPAFRTK